MPYFTEQARTYGECMERIRAKYGKDAKVKVLDRRAVWKKGFMGIGGHEEVELTGVYDDISFILPDRPQMPLNRPAVPQDLETAKRQIMEIAESRKDITSRGVSPLPRDPAEHTIVRGSDPSIRAVLKEINNLGASVRSLNEKMDATISGSQMSFNPSSRDSTLHPSLQKLEEDLSLNEFTPSFIKTILDRVRREFPLHELDNYEEVQKRVILWIGEQISVYREAEQPLQGKKKARVIALVGPTGVGKTTTVIKLAAMYGEWERTQGLWQKQIRLITLDCYRIGAQGQIEKYGEIMDVPVNTAESYDDLKKLLALYRQDVDYILIDTIGKSPRNYSELGQIKAILDACPAKTEIYLCIQASTKGGDLREVLKHFDLFRYKSVIITKMDETSRVGNVISVLAEEQKSVSFVTTGQIVPWDMERATVIRLLDNLEGFVVDRHALMDHFSSIEDKGVEKQ